MKSTAAIYHEFGKPLIVDTIELADPAPDEVLIKQFATGVCHSQLHQLHDLKLAQPPSILGHESTGVVIARGGNVTHVREGDHVMTAWLPRSPGYSWSLPARPAYEWNGRPLGPATAIGTWAEHILVHEQFVTLLPADLPTDVTSIIGCAVMTGAGAVMNTAGVRPGDSVAVFGVGGVGLSAISAAAALGADPIIAIDLDETKLALARRFGATHGIDGAASDPVAEVQAITGGGADFAFDAIGVPATNRNTLYAVRAGVGGHKAGGTAVLIGIPTQETTIDLQPLLYRNYRGSWGGSSVPDRDFPIYLRWYREGKLDLEGLVTHRFKLEQINEALAALQAAQIMGRGIIEF